VQRVNRLVADARITPSSSVQQLASELGTLTGLPSVWAGEARLAGEANRGMALSDVVEKAAAKMQEKKHTKATQRSGGAAQSATNVRSSGSKPPSAKRPKVDGDQKAMDAFLPYCRHVVGLYAAPLWHLVSRRNHSNHW
jgi:hypothetical protein